MELLTLTDLNVPLDRLIVYVFLITICLFLNRIQLGLAITFVFVFYLGFIFNYQMLKELVSGSLTMTGLYFFSGGALLIMALISFLKRGRAH